jgi:multiple antibiotic resistance protein
MGATLANVLTRIFGILLAALAAQFVVDGIKGAFGL